jgi:hypothetical protein
MTKTLVGSSELTITDCCVCGVVFAVPDRFLMNRREKGSQFFCPNGHSLIYRKTEAQRLQEELDRVKRQLDWSDTHARAVADQLDAAERSNRALRGSNTKLRKRIAAGVCPCCQRPFQNLARHMAGQHPDYAEVDHG